jgi:histidine triad (HIT) family protein
MKPDPNCLFCRIAKGEGKTEMIAQTPSAFAIRDINPQAPDHVLVIPRDHWPSLAECDDQTVLADLLIMAHDVARKVHIDHGGYRIVINTGDHGGQTVPHLHLHVLGGRRMKWPPG